MVVAGNALALIAVALLLVSCDPVTVSEESSGRTLCKSDFQTCVNPIFNTPLKRNDGQTVTCASGGCHEVGAGFGGAFKIFPNAGNGTTEMDANFIVAKAFANIDVPQDSKLLLEPLQGASLITGSHTGGDIFTGQADACYVVIQNWIANPVSDEASPQCGACVPANFAQCGFP